MRIPTFARASASSGFACLTIACLGAANSPANESDVRPDAQWQYYGGDAAGTRSSSLDQINKANVGQLEVAWTYRTGELGQGFARADKLTFEATPVLLGR